MNKDTIFKTAMYLLTTTLIGIVAQLDGLDFNFNNISTNAWIGIIFKSALPGLMTIKALFDVPSNVTKNTEQNG